MPGLLDLLGLNNSGSGLLGLGQPTQITPQQSPGGIDPQMYAAMIRPQQPTMFDNPLVGFGLGLASGNTAGEGIGNAQRAMQMRQQQESAKQQQALQNYLALKQLSMQEKASEEKPQYQKITGPDGAEHIVLLQPFGRGAQYITPSNSPAGGATDVQPPPPGVANVKKYNENLADEAAKLQLDSVKSAKAAADIQPLLDEAASAYKEVQRLGGAGPVIASTPGRWLATGMASLGDATGLGSSNKDAEVARQRYDRALSAIQARITAAQNSGQGAVSNYERQLYAMQFPQLNAVDAGDQQRLWDHLASENRRTIQAGQKSPLAAAAPVATVMDRAPIAQPGQPGQRVQTSVMPQQQSGPPAGAITALRSNPALRDQFDAKYGAGASARVLGQ